MIDYKFYKKYHGKVFADLVQTFYETRIKERLSNSCLDVLFEGLFKNEEASKKMQKLNDSICATNMEHAYSHGLQDGITFYADLTDKKKNKPPHCEYVNNKDFTIMFDFSDNDFGSFLSEAMDDYASTYQHLLNQIDRYSDEDDEWCRNYIKELEGVEKPEFIARYMKVAFISQYMLSKVDDSARFNPSSLGMEDFDASSFIKSAEKSADYLELGDPKEYRVGTYEEIEKYVLEKFKDMQENGTPKELKKYWLNGEVLFFSVRNGEIDTWVQ